MAKKLVEEAIEVGLDAVQMNREAVILESADVLYHLTVVWAECGIAPADVFNEIDRRERLYGIAEKLPKQAMPRICNGCPPPPRAARPPNFNTAAPASSDSDLAPVSNCSRARRA